MLQMRIIYIHCESGLSLKDPKIDMGTGKMCSKPTEAPQPLPPLSHTEIKIKRERDSHTMTAQHTFPAPNPAASCLFTQEVVAILHGWAGQLETRDLNITWHGIHGNIGLEWNGPLPVPSD